jgi:hypothetical protein
MPCPNVAEEFEWNRLQFYKQCWEGTHLLRSGHQAQTHFHLQLVGRPGWGTNFVTKYKSFGTASLRFVTPNPRLRDEDCQVMWQRELGGSIRGRAFWNAGMCNSKGEKDFVEDTFETKEGGRKMLHQLSVCWRCNVLGIDTSITNKSQELVGRIV